MMNLTVLLLALETVGMMNAFWTLVVDGGIIQFLNGFQIFCEHPSTKTYGSWEKDS